MLPVYWVFSAPAEAGSRKAIRSWMPYSRYSPRNTRRRRCWSSPNLLTLCATSVRNPEPAVSARGGSYRVHLEDPTGVCLAGDLAPESNKKRDKVDAEEELRVLVATDVLSEGQNLQDAAIVVNFDLPWAIIRLIQRAGRVDRIGQKSERIPVSYSFLPADGVENLIRTTRSRASTTSRKC